MSRESASLQRLCVLPPQLPSASRARFDAPVTCQSRTCVGTAVRHHRSEVVHSAYGRDTHATAGPARARATKSAPRFIHRERHWLARRLAAQNRCRATRDRCPATRAALAAACQVRTTLVGRFPIVLASLPTGGRLNRQPNEARCMADNGKPSSQRASADTILRIRDQPPANSSVHISGMPVVIGYHLGACKQTRRLRPRAVLCATGQNKHCF